LALIKPVAQRVNPVDISIETGRSDLTLTIRTFGSLFAYTHPDPHSRLHLVEVDYILTGQHFMSHQECDLY